MISSVGPGNGPTEPLGSTGLGMADALDYWAKLLIPKLTSSLGFMSGPTDGVKHYARPVEKERADCIACRSPGGADRVAVIGERIVPEQTFDAKTESRLLLREATTGSLATLDAEGFPFASLVTLATLPDATLLLLLSALAVHTQNLERDPRVSVLIAGGPRTRDPLTSPRVTILGTARKSPDPDLARRRFLARHPEASGYAGFNDFSFWEVAIARGHLVAGFGRIAALAADDLVTRDAGVLLETEESAIAHMNEDHADAVRLYATRLLGEEDGNWRVVGLDPDGLDLAARGRMRRLPFPEPVTTAQSLRGILKRLADDARAR